MDKEKIKELSRNRQFIAGIYNYCDRWCERCAFSARCSNFALAEEALADPESRDITNRVFWQKLSETFQVTIDLLQEVAEEEGIDLDALDDEELAEEERAKDEFAQHHECSRAAKLYGEKVDEWFESARDFFGEREDGLDLNGPPGLRRDGPVGEGPGLEDSVEVVRWYQHLIYAKIMRALHGQMEEAQEIDDEFAKDSDGSAKVALIAIDRSIAAWGELRDHFPLFDAEILDLLLHLDRLRKSVERVFPDARGFVRPGFDKVHLNS
jgi:hypothetical protein